MARLLARGELDSPHDDAPPDPQSEALAAFGLRLEREAESVSEFYLWTEHRPALELWLRVQTQWRVGHAGATGLDYTGVEAALRVLAPRKRRQLFRDLQVMERATLNEWAAQRER